MRIQEDWEVPFLNMAIPGNVATRNAYSFVNTSFGALVWHIRSKSFKVVVNSNATTSLLQQICITHAFSCLDLSQHLIGQTKAPRVLLPATQNILPRWGRPAACDVEYKREVGATAQCLFGQNGTLKCQLQA